MIYTIRPDIKRCLLPHIDSKEARRKLGRSTRFHYDLNPVPYADKWAPVEIEYYKETGTDIPDIGMANGRLFLNSKAYLALRTVLEPYGEMLPATYQGNSIYIFVGLKVAETAGVLDEENCQLDEHGHLERIAFVEDKFGANDIYRADWDYWQGIYCGERLKGSVEDAQLTGLRFTENLARVSPNN